MTDEEKNNDDEKKKIKLIEVESMRDLLSLTTGPMGSVNRVHHIELANNHLYFLVGGVPGAIVLYFIKTDKIEKRYIVYNNLTDEISYSDKKISNPQTANIPIINIKKQNLVTEEDFKDFI
ncbi:MAG: hypothetical protein ACTSVY_12975 [Candidatus Helarchaeota archaeon]